MQAKLAQLHRHAEVMLDSVLNNPNITEESVKAMAQHERCVLQMGIHKISVGHQHGLGGCSHCCLYIQSQAHHLVGSSALLQNVPTRADFCAF